MTTVQYIDNINQKYKLGNATEHTFRGLLEQLIESIVPDIRATNEPKRQSCGAPDYILTRGDIPVGFIEAKDIGDKDLKGEKKTGNKEQFDRYKASLPNLIFTDYLDFHLYRDGKFVTSISIGELTDKGVLAKVENFIAFENLIIDFCVHISQTIKSSKQLAEMMAGKARLLSDVIGKALVSDEINHENSTLKDQMKAFKDILIHDITPQGFADVYAQTIVYGMFCARLHDPTLPTFSRQEAYELIPKSNPFLKKLFGYIAGLDLDDRIVWIVDSLVELFLACNVEELLKNYGKQTKMENPIIHFYEDFLSEYDPKLRKARGVWYTPAPVVNFIVRAVDDILKTEFNLPEGIADTSKTTIKVQAQGTNKPIEQEVHKVQILDPATGTGTFLAEVIRHIHKRFEGQQGIWTNYVEQHLIPRLNGFELLMASYAMAHLQLDLLLTETGYKPSTNQRIRVFLTNSLEESHPDTGTLFANWLSTEANEANQIKRDAPVMCVIGNPPYAVSSTNKGAWIEKLTSDYKKGLNERNIQPLSDDYIKFIRYGQHFIEKTGEGILAYISNNSFIDGIIHRKMREELIKTFDKVYILDLHGNAKKKEVCLDGSIDQNVFDIMQGVSINIFVKKKIEKTKTIKQLLHFDLQGKREFKYDFLNKKSLSTIEWNILEPEAPNFFLVEKDFEGSVDYEKGFTLDNLFVLSGMGIATGNDDELVSFEKEKLELKFGKSNKFYYRPFDVRYVVFDNKLLQRARYNLMVNYLSNKNIGLNIVRQSKSKGVEIMISDNITNRDYITNHTYSYPLYIYPYTSKQDVFETSDRRPNLNLEIVNQIAEKLNLKFTIEKETLNQVQSDGGGSFAPIDILDYIYAVLHSPSYREKYKEFLKIDFPRVPYPKDLDTFWKLVKLGGEIRQIHLLESPIVGNYITQYPIGGDNIVGKVKFIPYPKTKTEDSKIYTQSDSDESPYIEADNISFPQPHLSSNDDMLLHDANEEYNTKGDQGLGKVYINDTQYFDNVPEVAWHFYIGGYQPAQKWLKDRKERKLEFDDILHYQKIIVALTETDRLMKEVDKIEIEKIN
jgi:hypothetical protein